MLKDCAKGSFEARQADSLTLSYETIVATLVASLSSVHGGFSSRA
jgi:hypothetical protein